MRRDLVRGPGTLGPEVREEVIEKRSDGDSSLARTYKPFALDLPAPRSASSQCLLSRPRRPRVLARPLDHESRFAVLHHLAAPRGVVGDPPAGAALKDSAIAPHRS